MGARRLGRPAVVVLLVLLSARIGAEEPAAVAPGLEFKDSAWHKLWFATTVLPVSDSAGGFNPPTAKTLRA